MKMWERKWSLLGRAHTLGIAAAMALLSLPKAEALSFSSGFEGFDRAIKRLPVSTRTISLHPFHQNAFLSNALDGTSQTALQLHTRGRLGFHDAMHRLLRAQSLHPLIEIRGNAVAEFGLRTGRESRDYRFYVGGVPLCGFQVRAHQLADQQALVLGALPDIGPYEPAPARDWPDLELSLEQVTHATLAITDADAITLGTYDRCLHVSDGRLLPVWRMTVYADGLMYHALADAYETISLQPGFFDVDGVAKVYPNNRLDKELKDIALPGLTGDGTLSSAFLLTKVPAGYVQAKAENHVFAYAPTDQRFDEVQVYAHAQVHLDYARSLGFEWYGPQPLELRIHVQPNGRPNNALFQPGSSIDNSKPSITIHGGDGIELQNLISDGDVVSHELGHHVIYKTLRSTEGESLVLHEGLADFLAFSRTNDHCLGESICPVGSGACMLEGRCLRTAANDLVYNDENWVRWGGGTRKRLGHLHGQLISGLLWDLRDKHGAVPEELALLVMKAVSYFREDSGFRDFMLALFTADRELFQNKYAQIIHTAGTERGLGEFFADVTPGQAIPPLEGGNPRLKDGVAPPVNATQEKKKKKSSPFSCGTIMNLDTPDTGFALLLALLLPLALALRPLPRTALVRRPKHPPQKPKP